LHIAISPRHDPWPPAISVGGTGAAVCPSVTDILYVAVVIAFFGIAWAYTLGTEHL
jgi:hypothetical protein